MSTLVAFALLAISSTGGAAEEASTKTGALIRSFEPVRVATEDTTAITGRVLDARDKPVSNASVLAIATPRTGYLGLVADDIARNPVTATSDAQGVFHLAFPRGRACELRVRAPDGSIGYVPASFAGEAVTIVLAPPATIDVHLFDASTKHPLAGVEVAAQWLESAGEREFGSVAHRLAGATTDAQGIAHLSGLPPALVDIVYDPSGAGAANARPWRVLAGESGTLEFPVSQRCATLHGRVVDMAGKPIVGARVSPSLRAERSVETDSDGNFALSTFASAEGFTIFARKEGFALSTYSARKPGSEDDAPSIVLQPGRSVRGLLIDAAGKGVADASIAFVNEATWGIGAPETQDLVFGKSALNGEFEVRGLRADVQHALVVASRQHALFVRDLPQVERGSLELSLPTIALEVPASISGKVADDPTHSAPVRDADVVLTSDPMQGSTTSGSDTAVISRPEALIGSVRTDCAGRFHFAAPPAAAVWIQGSTRAGLPLARILTTDAGDRLRVVLAPIAQPPNPGPAPACSVAGEFSARCVARDGSPAPRVALVVCPENVLSTPLRTTFADDAGRFVLPFVPEGCYRLTLESRDGFANASVLRARRSLSSAEFAAFARSDSAAPERTLTLRDVAHVRGRMVDTSGAPMHSWLLSVTTPVDNQATACVATDREGRFEFEIESEAPVTLLATLLDDDATTPHSGLGVELPRRFIVRDVVVGQDELRVEVPH